MTRSARACDDHRQRQAAVAGDEGGRGRGDLHQAADIVAADRAVGVEDRDLLEDRRLEHQQPHRLAVFGQAFVEAARIRVAKRQNRTLDGAVDALDDHLRGLAQVLIERTGEPCLGAEEGANRHHDGDDRRSHPDEAS